MKEHKYLRIHALAPQLDSAVKLAHSLASSFVGENLYCVPQFYHAIIDLLKFTA